MKNILYTIALAIILSAVVFAVFQYAKATDKAQEDCQPIAELKTLLCGEDLIEYKN